MQQLVTVHKEGLPIRKGESVHDYTRAIHTAAVATFTQKLNVQKGKAGLYVCEVFQSSLIFEVYKYESTDPKDQLKYYAATYKRKDDDSFEFGDTTEVQRVTRYETKPSVTKSLEGILPPEVIWAGDS